MQNPVFLSSAKSQTFHAQHVSGGNSYSHPIAGAQKDRANSPDATQGTPANFSTSTSESDHSNSDHLTSPKDICEITADVVRIEIRELVHLVENTYWPKRKGLQCKKIFLTHLRLALAAGSMEYSVSIEELANMSGETKHITDRSTQELLRSGALAIIGHYSLVLPNRYRITAIEDTIRDLTRR